MIRKAEDMEAFSKYFSDAHLQELEVEFPGKHCSIELLAHKEEDCFYSIK